ncbi:hypothetical protein [Streptomyces sp. NPDC048825]|uniref:hypothetical protein n=1 Tax=Streptomyces sp. NPDC048825 TaxID=3365592 RepID=UPI0037228092
MNATTFQSFAEALMAAGSLGMIAMILYKAALRHVDWELIPKAALPRVRWWSTYATRVLVISGFALLLGLAARIGVCLAR